MSMMMITHDLGVVAETAQTVAVMYLGRVVETADVRDLFRDPKHPYTQAMLNSIPRLGRTRPGTPEPVSGMVPSPFNRPPGCPFHHPLPEHRCRAYAIAKSPKPSRPRWRTAGRSVASFIAHARRDEGHDGRPTPCGQRAATTQRR